MNDLVPIIAGAPPFHRPLQRRGIHAELLLRQLALLLRHRNPIGAISFHHTALVSPVSILIWGLEGGIAIGIVLATLYFAFAYARVRCLNRISDSCDGTIASVGDIHFLHTFKGEGLPN